MQCYEDLSNVKIFFIQIQRKYGIMAFTLRDFVDENKARLGSIECLKSNMIAPYPVVYAEKGNERMNTDKMMVNH